MPVGFARVTTVTEAGKTFPSNDVEFTPTERGDMRLDLLTASGKSLGAIAIHVR